MPYRWLLSISSKVHMYRLYTLKCLSHRVLRTIAAQLSNSSTHFTLGLYHFQHCLKLCDIDLHVGLERMTIAGRNPAAGVRVVHIALGTHGEAAHVN